MVAVSEASFAAERKSLEERVRRLEAELAAEREKTQRERDYWRQMEAIIDQAPLAIYMKDAGHKYVLVNKEYEKLSAQKRENVLGREDFDVLPHPVAALFREQDLQVLAAGKPVEFKETITLHDGVHSFITVKFPVSAQGAMGCGVAGVCTEITALEEAKRQLEKAQTELVSRERLAALGELSAVVAHEVRNPLGVIFNSLATLKRLPHPAPEARQVLAIIGEEADRLNRMVGALLELVRPMQADRAPTELEPLLVGAIEAARTIADPQADVRLELAPATPPVLVDTGMLRQAIVNLVTNAIQAPRRRGPVQVRAAVALDDCDRLQIQVSDDGTGVPAELRERIFAPFFTTRATGTGLGLAVVRRVAEAHRGSVAMSDTPGGGATFTLTLPVRG